MTQVAVYFMDGVQTWPGIRKIVDFHFWETPYIWMDVTQSWARFDGRDIPARHGLRAVVVHFLIVGRDRWWCTKWICIPLKQFLDYYLGPVHMVKKGHKFVTFLQINVPRVIILSQKLRKFIWPGDIYLTVKDIYLRWRVIYDNLLGLSLKIPDSSHLYFSPGYVLDVGNVGEVNTEDYSW